MKQFSPRADGSCLHGARQSAYIRKTTNLLASGLARPLHKNSTTTSLSFWPGRPNQVGGGNDHWPEKTKIGTYVCPIIGYRDRTKAFSRVAAR
jgi:hypothetical protein